MKQQVVIYECDNCHVEDIPEEAPYQFPKDWADVRIRQNGGPLLDNYQLCADCLRAVIFALQEVRLLKD